MIIITTSHNEIVKTITNPLATTINQYQLYYNTIYVNTNDEITTNCIYSTYLTM